MNKVSQKNALFRLKDMVLESLKNQNVGVVLFGSRARGDNRFYSDVDIGIIPHGAFDKTRITILREKIEESTIPYKVEIVNLEEASEDFKKEILKGAVVWKD